MPSRYWCHKAREESFGRENFRISLEEILFVSILGKEYDKLIGNLYTRPMPICLSWGLKNKQTDLQDSFRTCKAKYMNLMLPIASLAL